jgi:Ni,Fe-hydrogenase I large subunit
MGISLKLESLRQKREQMHDKTDSAFEEKYKRVREVFKEVLKSEQNIRKNYNFVDNVIIPQLKAISSTYKENQKKYSKMKKYLDEIKTEEIHCKEFLSKQSIEPMRTGKFADMTNTELLQVSRQYKQKLEQINIVRLMTKLYIDNSLADRCLRSKNKYSKINQVSK